MIKIVTQHPTPHTLNLAFQILLVLTEDPSDAASLAKADGVIAAVSKACEEALPPRIIRNLLVVYSRLSAAKDLR